MAHTQAHKLDCFIENPTYDTTSVYCTCDWSYQATNLSVEFAGPKARLAACRKAIRSHVLAEAGS